MRRWSEAWKLLDGLAELDRERRARTSSPDDEVRVRELIVLTSMLRIARHEGRLGARVNELTQETADLARATPQRLLTRNPSLLRDLAGEIGQSAPEIVQLAVSALATEEDANEAGSRAVRPAASPELLLVTQEALIEAGTRPINREFLIGEDIIAEDIRQWQTRFIKASDASQEYLEVADYS